MLLCTRFIEVGDKLFTSEHINKFSVDYNFHLC